MSAVLSILGALWLLAGLGELWMAVAHARLLRYRTTPSNWLAALWWLCCAAGAFTAAWVIA